MLKFFSKIFIDLYRYKRESTQDSILKTTSGSSSLIFIHISFWPEKSTLPLVVRETNSYRIGIELPNVRTIFNNSATNVWDTCF